MGMQAVCEHIPSRLKEFTAQGLSITIYTFGIFSYSHDSFLRAFCAHLPGRLAEFDTHHISSTMLSLSRLFQGHDKVMLHDVWCALSAHVTDRISEFKILEISNM